MRSFNSNENIHKKEGGSYYVVSANKASSVTLFAKASFSVSVVNCRNKALQPSSLGKATVIINFAKHSQSFIVVTVGW